MSIVNTNYLSLVAQGNLNKSQGALGQAIERLSSGLRINSAKDDAAGQAIANRMTAQVRGLTQAARNANDGISIAQTAEGSLNEINNNLQRIRQLAVQATNGTNSKDDLASINDEVKARLEEIDRVAQKTQFNGVNVLNNDQDIKIQVGSNDGDTISIAGIKATVDDLFTGAKDAAGNDITGDLPSTSAGILDATTDPDAPVVYDDVLAAVDWAIKQVDTKRSDLGAIQNRFESAITNLNNTITNLSASRSRIEDADYAVEVSNMTRAQILQQAGTSVLAQANQVPQTVLSLLR
ncbi:MAG: flagellin [Alcaligenes sp.]